MGGLGKGLFGGAQPNPKWGHFSKIEERRYPSTKGGGGGKGPTKGVETKSDEDIGRLWPERENHLFWTKSKATGEVSKPGGCKCERRMGRPGKSDSNGGRGGYRNLKILGGNGCKIRRLPQGGSGSDMGQCTYRPS